MNTRKPKILHIGGSHSVHVADLVTELHKLGYPQCVLSYNKTSLLPKEVQTYFFPYHTTFYPHKINLGVEAKLKKYLSSILKIERPDIIHGHFLVFSCVAINMASQLSGLPVYLTPWSSIAWTTDKILHGRIDSSIANAKYFLLDQKWVFDIFKQYYPNTLKDSMHIPWRMPLYLSFYHDLTTAQKDISRPKILSARVMREKNHQDLFIHALPAIFTKHPDAIATLIIGQSRIQGVKYYKHIVSLSKHLGVYGRCRFIGRALSQTEFSNVIKDHNIVYSVSESDMGGSQTTYQAMYSGAITVVKTSPYGYLPLVPGDNALVTDLTKESVQNVMMHAADNVANLCGKFFDNSRFLRYLSCEYTVPTLTELYDQETVSC